MNPDKLVAVIAGCVVAIGSFLLYFGKFLLKETISDKHKKILEKDDFETQILEKFEKNTDFLSLSESKFDEKQPKVPHEATEK